MPKSLPTASLAANRAAKFNTGLARARQYAISADVKRRCFQTGMTRQSSLETLHFHQVQPHKRPAGYLPPGTWPPVRVYRLVTHRARRRTRFPGPVHRYSTVTVLARLRGWSTFSPLCLAT